MNESRLTLAERRQIVLEAGARKLASGNFVWNTGVTYEWLSDETGIDLARISKDFGRRDNFSEDLAAFCLAPPQGADQFLNVLTLTFEDTTLTFQELIVSMARFIYLTHTEDPAVYARKLMFSVSIFDDSVQKLMTEEYGAWADELGRLLSCWLDAKRNIGQPVDLTMTARDFILTLTALVEGSLLMERTKVHSNPVSLFEQSLRVLVDGALVPGQTANQSSALPTI